MVIQLYAIIQRTLQIKNNSREYKMINLNFVIFVAVIVLGFCACKNAFLYVF